MLVEKFVAVISVVSAMEIEGEMFQALDTVESDPKETHEEAVKYIEENHSKYGEEFHYGKVNKVFVKA